MLRENRLMVFLTRAFQTIQISGTIRLVEGRPVRADLFDRGGNVRRLEGERRHDRLGSGMRCAGDISRSSEGIAGLLQQMRDLQGSSGRLFTVIGIALQLRKDVTMIDASQGYGIRFQIGAE